MLSQAVPTAPVQTCVVPIGAVTGHVTLAKDVATLPVVSVRLLDVMTILFPVPVPPI